MIDAREVPTRDLHTLRYRRWVVRLECGCPPGVTDSPDEPVVVSCGSCNGGPMFVESARDTGLLHNDR